MASRRNSPEPTAPLLESERKALSGGIAFALGCAAALSAPTLYLLACLIGYPPQLAWLLPASFDGYAGTSIWVGRRIPRTHPAAKAARRNARLALAMTISGNGLYHLLALAGNAVPYSVHIGLLVTVSSLPPFIVDRLLHLNAIANGSTDSATPAESATVRPKATPRAAAESPTPAVDGHPAAQSATAQAVHPPKPSTPADGQSPTQPTMDRWAEVGHPVYVRLKSATGKRPQQAAYRDALAEEVARLVGAGELPETYADPSLTTAKRVRAAVEERDPDLSPVHLVADDAREAS